MSENLGQRTNTNRIGKSFQNFHIPKCGTSKASPGACKVLVKKLGGVNSKTHVRLRVCVCVCGRGFTIDVTFYSLRKSHAMT